MTVDDNIFAGLKSNRYVLPGEPLARHASVPTLSGSVPLTPLFFFLQW